MMDKYTVSAQIDSQKFGKGKLVADLSHDDFVKYANLSDKDKLSFLKEHDAQLHVDLADLQDSDVSDYRVNKNEDQMVSSNPSSRSQTHRKMRMNINGQDTGWIDVTDENEEQYNQMMNQFNKMHQQFNQRFNKVFGDSFSKWLDVTPNDLLDHRDSDA